MQWSRIWGKSQSPAVAPSSNASSDNGGDRNEGDRNIVEASGLFDARWYLRHCPEAADSGLHPVDHYSSEGWQKGYSPGPLFDAPWYLDQYRDVAESGTEPLLHFIRHGAIEGRKTQGSPTALMAQFQSLGDNCEFGLVQRRLGVETLDLFRFARTNIKGLIAALESRLSEIAAPDGLALELRPARHEYVICAKRYGFDYHIVHQPSATNGDQIRDDETKRLKLLSRKFIEDIEDGEKIFVFKSNYRITERRVKNLLAAMRRYGPCCLLWVTPETRRQPVGHVEAVSDGLLHGFIDRFAPYEDANDYSLGAWQTICRNAYDLWHARRRRNGAP